MACALGSKMQRCLNILGLKVGKVAQYLLWGRIRGEQLKYVHNPYAHSANARFAATLLWICRNALR